MRVALVVPGGVDRSGERRVIPALVWLLRRLHRYADVQVVALYQYPRRSHFTLFGVPVENVGRPLTRPRAVASLIAAHRVAPFDVVHAFWATAPGEIAVAAGAVLRRPVVVHVAGGELASLPDIEYGGYRSVGARARRRFVIRNADAVTAASQPVIDAAERLGRPAIRIPLGAGMEDWPPRAPRARARSQVARLVHVASLNRVKDQETLLRALTRVLARGVRCHLDIVGEDTLGGGVQRAAYELGVAANVTFHGFLPQKELRPVIEAADLLVVSSRYEAGPVVLSEAALVGVPTVGTAVGQIRDWAPDAAVAVPIADSDALADAIAALLDDESRRLAIAAAAQARAHREDADWTARRFAALYDRLSNRSG